ncbi:MAG: zinc-dependent alcohol dehydrogenase [Actinomycetota bacterium]
MESPGTAKAMLLVEPRRLNLHHVPVKPVGLGGWLAIEATGISGADVQIWKGDRAEIVYPIVLGHQIVGRIATNDGFTPYEVGTRVVVEPELRCGSCSRCRNHVGGCRRRLPINSYGRLPATEPPGLWGGLAEFLYLDPSCRLHPVSDDISAEMATFIHPLASGYTWAVESAELQRGERVMVLGPGPRGLACVAAAVAGGASWVGISGLDVDADRLKVAEKLGAHLTVDASSEDVPAAVADHLGTRPDVVIDVTSDDPEAMFTALDLVRSGGRVILGSTKGNRPVQFFSDVIVTKQLTVRGVFGASSAGYTWASNKITTDPALDDLVSHQFPLGEAQRAMQAAAGMLGHDELISVAVTF